MSRTHTKLRAAATTSDWDRKLLSISCLPGHQIPETPAQCGAAETSRIGLRGRAASALPAAQEAIHWMPGDPLAGTPPAFAWSASLSGGGGGGGLSRLGR